MNAHTKEHGKKTPSWPIPELLIASGLLGLLSGGGLYLLGMSPMLGVLFGG